MKATEKAEELLDKFHIEIMDFNITDVVLEDTAKQCALIAADEIIEALERNAWQNGAWIGYYNEVKQEIEKL